MEKKHIQCNSGIPEHKRSKIPKHKQIKQTYFVTLHNVPPYLSTAFLKQNHKYQMWYNLLSRKHTDCIVQDKVVGAVWSWYVFGIQSQGLKFDGPSRLDNH